jgi:glycosyltransferase involved in cell wall biosynthesis
VLAFAGGAVAEIVHDGVNGWICGDVAEMTARAAAPAISHQSCRSWVSSHFSRERMVDRYLDVYQRARSGRGHTVAQEAATSWKT